MTSYCGNPSNSRRNGMFLRKIERKLLEEILKSKLDALRVQVTKKPNMNWTWATKRQECEMSLPSYPEKFTYDAIFEDYDSRRQIRMSALLKTLRRGRPSQLRVRFKDCSSFSARECWEHYEWMVERRWGRETMENGSFEGRMIDLYGWHNSARHVRAIADAYTEDRATPNGARWRRHTGSARGRIRRISDI